MVSSRHILSANPNAFLLHCIFPPTLNKKTSFHNFSIADLLNLAYPYLCSLVSGIFFLWALYRYSSLLKMLI